MNNLVQKVSEYMQEYHMVEEGQKIVVGVSGGADSMGLLAVLYELAEYFHLSLVVVHVNHGVRGQAADGDQSYVEDVCREKDVPCYSFHVDLKRFARKEGMSQEEAGTLLSLPMLRKSSQGGRGAADRGGPSAGGHL